jgi:two-component system nitrate/nitrite sensor histidine kinase NarX
VVDARGLDLHITDDGCGFAAGAPSTSHHGLRIMRERAELLDAGLQIISRPGAGTTVVVCLPLPTLRAEEAHA